VFQEIVEPDVPPQLQGNGGPGAPQGVSKPEFGIGRLTACAEETPSTKLTARASRKIGLRSGAGIRPSLPRVRMPVPKYRSHSHVGQQPFREIAFTEAGLARLVRVGVATAAQKLNVTFLDRFG
jgi:hypothetical protein